MSDLSFVSYSQNGEDVVLWRALSGVAGGRYVEVGGNDPTVDSVSRAFYERGWSGVVLEPVAEFAARFREERPRDTVLEAAAGSGSGETTLHVIAGTGLSSTDPEVAASQRARGWQTVETVVQQVRLDDVLAEHVGEGEDVHFLLVDVEGAEREVLGSLDLHRWRPWVLVVEATAPSTDSPTHEAWEHLVLSAGYRLVLFDGLSRFYVADEHADLAPRLSYPASPADGAIIRRDQVTAERIARLEEDLRTTERDLVRWRGVALNGWAGVQGHTGTTSGIEAAELRAEMQRLQATLSWRVTAPLRQVRRLQTGLARRR
ncbi:FkbM family methyltransferase [Aquipuribacter hungaricus]|uniref:FkbM family methyltransferase n=1 Tax=Aquipuribacter hungaricus TaxID=545624 RepID=A0ABV7WLX4_9MICO